MSVVFCDASLVVAQRPKNLARSTYPVSSPFLPYFKHRPATSDSTRVVTVTSPDISATLASASPRNPNDEPPTFLRSSKLWILLVKARLQTFCWSSGEIPWPLSLSCMTSTVFWEISTCNDVAEASKALSTSSLTTEQGSDMADVEPIARIVFWGRASIVILHAWY